MLKLSVNPLRGLRSRLVLVAAVLGLVISAASGAEPGVITGTISNAATRNLLPGARVEIPALARG